MDKETPHIEVRAVHVEDAPALYELDYSFESDRIYTLHTCNQLILNGHDTQHKPLTDGEATFAFTLIETRVDPPIYKSFKCFKGYQASDTTVSDIEARLRAVEGGFVALAGGQVAGCILLNVKAGRSVTLIEDLTVDRQFLRYNVGSLLLNCALDWARHHKCWAIVAETHNTNYPAIQFYLRNGLEIWSINRHFYPPGQESHEVAIFMGKHLSSIPES